MASGGGGKGRARQVLTPGPLQPSQAWGLGASSSVEGLRLPHSFAPRAGALRGRFWQSLASLQRQKGAWGAAVGLRSNFQLEALHGLKSRPLSPAEVIRPNLAAHVGHQVRPGNADSGPGARRLSWPDARPPRHPSSFSCRPLEAGRGCWGWGEGVRRPQEPQPQAFLALILETSHLAWGSSEPSVQSISHKLPGGG